MPSSGSTVTASALMEARGREAMKNAPWACLVCTTGGHNKFWKIRSADRFLETWWGRSGTDGQRKVKEFDNAFQAQNERERLLIEKRTKGYVFASPPRSIDAGMGKIKGAEPPDWYALTPQERFDYVKTHTFLAAENFVQESRERRGFASVEPAAYELDWSAMSPSDHVTFVRRYGTQAAKDCAARSITATARPSAATPAKKKLLLLVLPAGRFVQTVPMNGEEESEAPAPKKGRKRRSADRPHGGAAVALGRFFSLDHGGDDEEED